MGKELIMESLPSVGVVFATMNREDTAIACVLSLAAQTHPPDLVVVADNASSDGTANALECIPRLPFPLVVHRMGVNRGNAGGVQEAMEIAFARNMDAVWILDDDSLPRPDALRCLLDFQVSGQIVLHSLQIDPRTNDLTWPMQIHVEGIGWHTIHSLGEMPGEPVLETRNNWTGSLISRAVHMRVGPVMGELFIRGEDEEYPWRLMKFGISQRAITTSILDHPGPTRLLKKNFFGKTIYLETGLSDWKIYYKIRNMIWLQRRKRGLLHSLLMGMAYFIIVVRHEGIRRFPLVIEAFADGISSRLGRWRRHPC